MAEYIEREALERSLNERLNRLFKLYGRHDHYVQGFDDCVGRVEEFPAADVATVRHGRWVKICESGEPAIEQHQVGVFCSRCMKMPKDRFTEYDFCPNCGAKMDLED